MVVNSINFWAFFIIVFFVYYGISGKSSRFQNITLLLSSYVFYGMVDLRMCALLIIATFVFYYFGIAIAKQNKNNPTKASQLTTVGVLLGVGMLFYFKYLDFFIDQFASLLSYWGLQTNLKSFGIIMPLGISFFTFKLISYVIEIHRGTIEPSRDPIVFGVYVAFFPTIMSGPIDQPGKFLPQLTTVRKYTYDDLSEGAKRILWGMFLKMCIADQLSDYTGSILGEYEQQSATAIIFASILYYFYMYADFAGYSDMAIGISQMMGLRIAENFNRPIFAQNISEYWRRWHISLTSWITQYIYMPLNLMFRNIGIIGICLAAIINTVAIGAWHGANWTYILFGLYHGVVIAIIILVEKKRKALEKKYQLKSRPWYKYTRMLLTFVLVDFGMLLFQAESIGDFVGTLHSLGNGMGSLRIGEYSKALFFCSFSILIMLFREWKYENKKPLLLLHSKNRFCVLFSCLTLSLYIFFTGNLIGSTFLYFQF